MKNKLSDLNDHLFAQIERLNDDQLEGEKLELEIQRAKAIASVAGTIVIAAKVTLDAVRYVGKGEIDRYDLPKQINM